jgi:hypothetical protein
MFEKFNNTWRRLCDDKNNPQLRPFVKKGLDWVKKYYRHMGDTNAYIIAMRMCVLCPNHVTQYPFSSAKSKPPVDVDQSELGST